MDDWTCRWHDNSWGHNILINHWCTLSKGDDPPAALLPPLPSHTVGCECHILWASGIKSLPLPPSHYSPSSTRGTESEEQRVARGPKISTTCHCPIRSHWKLNSWQNSSTALSNTKTKTVLSFRRGGQARLLRNEPQQPVPSFGCVACLTQRLHRIVNVWNQEVGIGGG